jgi:septal ring-binding cell division protein DamX
MFADKRENQLELFDAGGQSAPRPRREAMGRFFIQVRHDQLVLAGISGLIGVAVIFATGVERGKQLARAERSLLVRQQPSAPEAPARPIEAEKRAAPAKVDRPQAPAPAKVPGKTGTRVASAEPAAAAPAAAQPKKAAAAKSSGSSRYAVQLATYSKPQLAKRELERLQAKGERAFLIMRNGRVVVYAGPFPSKDNAKEKVASLKGRYQDCFVKTL